MGVAYAEEMQGNDPDYFNVIATPKNYAVQSWPEPTRHEFNAIIDNKDFFETYLPAFEACIKPKLRNRKSDRERKGSGFFPKTDKPLASF
jgi:beta-glucosidase-like glycosyl hydrolase